ncbi:hypothetical protein EV715DRAFT_297687 [Schizophyllum commune]|nr:hypothetical protein K525DRAFT_274691 [Schizophyllum commune Loenen D]
MVDTGVDTDDEFDPVLSDKPRSSTPGISGDHPSSSTSLTQTGLPQFPTGCPEELRSAVYYIYQDLSPTYAALFASWALNEQRMGWPASKKGFPLKGFSAKHRPLELTTWIKRSKPLNQDPSHIVKDPQAFSRAWRHWHESLRIREENKAGPNGWYLHMVSLKWWKMRIGPERDEEWEAAVAMVREELDALNMQPT